MRCIRNLRAVAIAYVAMLALVPRTAGAVGGPVPGAASPQTVKLPASPGSVRGLAENATVSGYTGQVQYSVPIDLPDGPGGLSPSLSLGYDGNLGNGPLGVGWALSQAGVRRTLRLGVPTYTAADELELVGIAGGGQLVSLGNGEYRAEGQGNSYGGRIAGAGLEITDANGQVYRFGTSPAAQKTSAGRVAFWYLEETRDVAGQTISYHYRKDGGEVYLDSITWGPHVAGAPAFRAELIYEARGDAVVSYRTGFRVESAQRLTQIRAWSFGAMQRITTLRYEQSFALSRLHGITVTSPDGHDALPALTFTYAEPQTSAVTQIADLNGWALNLKGTSMFDVDGDGAMDLLRLTPNGHSYRRNLGGRFDAPRTVSGAPGASLDQVRLLDLTGDSGAELVWQQGSQWSVFQLTGADASNRSWTGLGTWSGAQSVSLSSVAVADLNGDYRMDVIQVSGSSIQVRLGGESGLAASMLRPAIDPARSFIAPGNSATSFPDINGDGLADVVYLGANSMFLYLGKGDGQFEKYADVPYPWSGSIAISQIRLGDLNRDGLLDIAVVRAGDVAWYRGRANGTLEPTPVQLPRPAGTDASVVVALADANGNGSEDIIWSSPSGMWILDFAGATSAGMLTTIDNGLGQTQQFGYQASAVLAFAASDAGAPWTTTMPVSIPVSINSRLACASGDPSRSSRLDVRDGIYDRSERRFVGFRESTLTRPDPADGVAPDQVVRQIQRYAEGLGMDRALRGRLGYERIEDGSGKVYRETTHDFVAVPVDGLSGTDPRLLRAITLQTLARRVEGSATPVEIHTRYQHDGEGRVVEEDSDGRIDLAGDESVKVVTYTVDDPVTHVRDKICEEETLGADGVSVAKLRRLYGDATRVEPRCQPGKGWLREEQAYLAEESRWVTQHQTTYAETGNPISIYSGGVSRRIAYDVSGVFAISETVTPEAGRDLTWTLDWDLAQGLPRRLSAPDGAVTTVSYDGVGRLLSIAHGTAPAHIRYRYDWTAPRPRTETYTFDGDPAVLTELPPTWTPTSGWRHGVEVTNSAGEPMLSALQLDTNRWIVSGLRTHDARGRTVTLADAFYAEGTDPVALPVPPALPARTVQYDALDRPIQQTQQNSSAKRISYTPLGLTAATDDLVPIETYLDGLGRTIRTERTVNGVVESVNATYDPAGRLLRFRLQDGQVDHDFTYDTLGRLIHAHDPDLGHRAMTYSDTGALIHSTNGAGQPTDYTYDGIGRLSTVIADDATTRFHYDQPRAAKFGFTAGRLAWVEEATGSVDLGYDVAGRQTMFRRQIVDGTTVVDATETSRFAPSGLLRSIEFDDGLALSLTYDAAGRPVGLGDDWTVDEQTAAGNILRERFGNGVVQTYERDVRQLATRVQVARPGAQLYDVAVAYNAYGAITSAIDHDGVGLDHTAQFAYDGGGRLTGASIGAAGPTQYQFAFAYDGLQNMLRRDVHGPTQLGVLAGEYRYLGTGPRQLSTVTRASDGAALSSFTYDAAGRQIQHGAKTMHYNAMSQLIRVDGVTTGTGSVEHAYGYDGERVVTNDTLGSATYWLTPDLIQNAGTRDHYLRMNGRTLLRITLASGASATAAVAFVSGLLHRSAAAIMAVLVLTFAMSFWSRRLARHPRLARAAYFALFAFVAPGCTGRLQSGSEQASLAWQTQRKLYFHKGVSAGPTLLTDATGAVFEERRYEPFGEPIDAYRDGSGVGTVDFRREPTNVLNKPTDPDTNLSFHGARWFPTDTAQWLTPDPPVKAPDPKFMAEPWALHPYQYVAQNPVLYWDPDGRDPEFSDLRNLTVEHGNPVQNFADRTGQRWRDATPITMKSAPYFIIGAVVYSCVKDPVGCGTSIANELLSGGGDELERMVGPKGLNAGKALRLVMRSLRDDALGTLSSGPKRLLPGLKLETKQFGKKAAQHLPDYGRLASSEADRSWLDNKIRSMVSNYDEVRQGAWQGGAKDNLFFRQASDIVVTKSDGTFVTILKDDVQNSWFRGAGPLAH